MARKSPWHAAGSAVYHECTNCTEGNNIETGNKISGTGGGRRCSRCSKLISQNNC